MRIYYINAPAGSGKTWALAKHARQLASAGSNVLFVQPTKELIDKTVAAYLADKHPFIPWDVIYSDGMTVGTTVAGQIINRLKSGFDGGGILFITHEAFLRLKWEGSLADWHLLIDEALTAFRCFNHVMPETHRLLTDKIEPVPSGIDGYSFAVVRDSTSIRKMASNKKGDEVWSQLQEVAAALESDRWLTYVHGENFEGVKSGKINTLLFFSRLHPQICDRFKSVTIGAANFTDSILFHLWSKQGVRFAEHPYLRRNLRFKSHENGHLLTIHYAYDGGWTKSGKSKVLKESEFVNLMGLMVHKLQDALGDREFLWIANKNDPDNLFVGMKGKRLPNVPHGLNGFQDYNCVVFLSALRLSSPNLKWFEAMGISADEIDAALHMEAAYQAIARSSLRSANTVDPVDIFIPDLETAQFLQSKFPGSKLNFLDWIPEPLYQEKKSGRPKIHKSDTDRKNFSKHKKDIEKAIIATNFLISDLDAIFDIIDKLPNSLEFIGDETIYCKDNNVIKSNFGMQFNSIYNRSPKAILVERSDDQFIERLHGLANRDVILRNKKEDEAITPAVYNIYKTEDIGRKRVNIEFVSGIWMDVDKGNVHPEEIARIFPSLHFAAFNSHSSVKGDWRSHLYFPTQNIFSVDAYRIITGRMMAMIENAGLVGCVDVSKLGPASLFFLPCRAKDPTGNFFFDFNESGRSALDVLEWLQAALNDHLARPEPIENGPFIDSPTIDLRFPRDEVMIENALKCWAEEGWKPGQGNDEFFNLVLKLVRAGVDDPELRSLLSTAAGTANSPDDRRRDIENLIARARKYAQEWLE